MIDDINTLTMILFIIVIAIVILFAVLFLVYFKSKKGKETKNGSSAIPESADKKRDTAKRALPEEPVEDFMEFDTITDNMIEVKNGMKYIMVVECQGINYDLMSELEKNAVEEGFVQFLNTLRHPIQIYTQTRTINLESSIQTYKSKIEELENNLEKAKTEYTKMVNSGNYPKEELDKAQFELTKQTNLYEYGKDIIYNTEKMSLNKNVLNQKYYIVIPYYADELGQNSFDKEEIRNLSFSELYTRAQSIIRTIAACGVNAKVLNSDELADLLYVAYNRDEAEVYGIDKALRAGFDELYSTAPDVLDKKIRILDKQIEEKAFEKANQLITEVKSEKQKAIEEKQENVDDLIDQLAKIILEENATMIGKDVAKDAIDKIDKQKEKKEKGGETPDGQKTKRGRRKKTV